MVVVHLDLDLIAGVAGTADMGDGISEVIVTCDSDGNGPGRARKAFGDRLRLIEYAILPLGMQRWWEALPPTIFYLVFLPTATSSQCFGYS